jgi:hypothetical protein
MCAMGTGAVMLLVGAPQLWAYVTQGWDSWAPSPPENTLEYRISEWITRHPPTGRVLATGGMRFRLDTWFDIQQIGGGFETGLQDRIPVDLAYHIRVGGGPWKGHETEETLLELKALGTEYVVIHGPKSREYYRDFFRTERIRGNLLAVFHTEDDTIYALPARPLAHLMKASELPDADVTLYPQALLRYVAAIEDSSRPVLVVHWTDAGAMTVAGPVPAADLIAVDVNANPGWQAIQDGHRIPLDSDRLGFIVLHPSAAAATRIELRYHGTMEQRIMAGVSLMAWIGAFVVLFRARRKGGRCGW